MEGSQSRWSHWRKRKGNVDGHIDYVRSSKARTPEENQNASPTPVTGIPPQAPGPSPTPAPGCPGSDPVPIDGVFDFAQNSPTESEVEPAAISLSHALDMPLVNLDHGELLDQLPVATDQESDDEFFCCTRW